MKHFFLAILLTFISCHVEKDKANTNDSTVSEKIDTLQKLDKRIQSEGLPDPVQSLYNYHLRDFRDSTDFKKLDSMLSKMDTVSALDYIQKKQLTNIKHKLGMLLAGFVIENSLYYPRHKPSPEVVRFLLQQGADVSTVCHQPMEASSGYDFVIVSCNEEISDLLIRFGSKVQLDGLVKCAVASKDISAIREAVKRGANSTFALEFAIDTDRALFQELIEKGADKDVALQLLVFRLLELKGIKYYNRFYRPEIDSLNAEPFYADVIMKMTTAYSSGYPDYTGFMDPYKTYTLGKLTSLKDTLLLKKLAPINPTRALPIAIKLRMNKFINQLLEIGASKDLALYFACEEEDEPLIRRLIASGARLKFRSKIAFSKNEKLKSILAPVTDGKPFSEHPNDGSAEDSSSIPSLLFKAIRQDNFSAVKFMLDAGADPNALMHFYDVSWALSSSIPELEESRLIDCEGISPLWISKYMEKKFGVNGKITKLLLTKGAKLSNKECLPQIETFRY